MNQILELLKAAGDPDPQMRETAIRALGTLAGSEQGDPSIDINNTLTGGVPAYVTAIEVINGALEDTDWGVRQSAAEMAVKLKTERADEGQRLLDDDLRSGDPEIQLGACWSLVMLGDSRAVSTLIQLLYVDDLVIVASAADALGDTGDQRAVAALMNLIHHEDQDVREAARDALDRLGYPVEDD